jgi:hypothetical protein
MNAVPLILLLVAAGRFAQAEPARDHWSLQPLRVTTPPAVQSVDWCQTPVDRDLCLSI